MSEKKYPRIIVGTFIFNEKNEVLMIKSVYWHGKYTVPGGSVELNEGLKEAVVREVEEETDLDISDIEFISVTEGLSLTNDLYNKPEDHLVFMNYKAISKSKKDIKLNEEATEYKWLTIEEWLNRDDVAPTAREVLEKSLSSKDSFENKYKRALADYQNLLKQTARDKEEFAKYANENLIREIIPVYDNLKISLEHADGVADNWVEGIKYVLKQFKDVLEKMGVEEIEAKGKFNPEEMEAIEGQGEKVERVVRSGYRLNGRVIVSAKVIVG